MSLSWAEPAVAWIGADEVRLHLRSRGHGEAMLSAPSHGDPAAALRTLLAQAPRPLRLQGVLSNRLLRFAALRGAHALRDRAERAAAGLMALQEAHGTAGSWQLALGRATRHGATLVAGLDAELHAQLHGAPGQGGHRWQALEPWTSHALRRARRLLRPRHRWLAVVEPGRAVLLRMGPDGIEAVQSHRLMPAAGETLAALLARQRLLDGSQSEIEHALVAGEATDVDAAALGDAWQLTTAPLSLAPAPAWRPWA